MIDRVDLSILATANVVADDEALEAAIGDAWHVVVVVVAKASPRWEDPLPTMSTANRFFRLLEYRYLRRK